MTPPLVRELWEMLELVEEILIRIPPDEPASIIRASLACKPWCRLLSGHAFRSRYLTFHKTPPLLGFLQSWKDDVERFAPTTNFRPRSPSGRDSCVLDCRHGRVLLRCEEEEEDGRGEEDDEDYLNMVVWDPVSGKRTDLRERKHIFADYSAAVLCAADGCNHIACNTGPFFVVFLRLQDVKDDHLDKCHAWVRVYSSETQEWTSTTSIKFSVGVFGASSAGRPSVMVGQALYFLLRIGQVFGILKYDLGTHCLSVIDLPRLSVYTDSPRLISANDGWLGVLDLGPHGLCTMWWGDVSVDGAVAWIQLRDIDFRALLPIGNPMATGLRRAKLVGCVEGTHIILVATHLGAFTVDLMSLRSRKLSSKPYEDTYLAEQSIPHFWEEIYRNLFLYMSFNNPPVVAGVEAEAGAGEVALGKLVEAWKFRFTLLVLVFILGLFYL